MCIAARSFLLGFRYPKCDFAAVGRGDEGALFFRGG